MIDKTGYPNWIKYLLLYAKVCAATYVITVLSVELLCTPFYFIYPENSIGYLTAGFVIATIATIIAAVVTTVLLEEGDNII